MSIRLLLDENLSERLLPLLSDRARADGDLLVTKDKDFLRLSMSRGFPPKVICLAIGNAGNVAFSNDPEAGFLLLSPSAQVS